MGDLSEFADELEPAESLFSIFSMQPDMNRVHIQKWTLLNFSSYLREMIHLAALQPTRRKMF